ncbi:MAG: S-layer homology domain-containing protein [Actinomycetota bacterium]
MGVPSSSRRAHCRALSVVFAIAAIAALMTPAGAYPGAPWFEPGTPYDQNFADPAIIEVDGTFYAYATTTGGASMPVMTSPDLETWTAHGDALGSGPSWSPTIDVGWSVWAPSVVELPTGDFLAAFAAQTFTPNRRCIALATATSPLGPFTVFGAEPFVCEPDPNGALDPFLIVDENDVPWLIWKNEGVPVGHPTLGSRRTGFWSRQLTDGGTAWRPGSTVNFLMETTEVARPWQGTLVENPTLTAWDNGYFLAYSANRWNSTSYATGWAVCPTPAGPCTQPSVHPLLVSNGERLGPGGPAAFVDDGVLHVGYHAWNPPYTDYPNYPSCDADNDGECLEGQRFLHIDTVCVAGAEAWVYEPHGQPFCDVEPGTYYTAAVAWLAEHEITTGISPSAYGARQTVSRAQMATFLWRLMGEPVAPQPAAFGDIPDGTYFTDAVAWLASAGVTTGVSPTEFDPNGTVTRAQMATFLWRLMGEPAGPTSTGFDDVPAGQYFSEAVGWLAEEGITTGTGPGIFDPTGDVTRAQMAAFLCRLADTPVYAGSAASAPACTD